jgi:Zn-dependent protease with chaperone function
MTSRRRIVVVALSLLLLGCTASLLVGIGCGMHAACVVIGRSPALMFSSWARLLAATGVAGLVAWVVRLTWVLAGAAKARRRLPTAAVSWGLARAARQAHVPRVALLDVDSSHAFCAGVWRPTVFVSQGLVGRLREQELLAVLWHEGCHARRRDPLRRAAYRSAADLLRPVTVVRWWTENRLDQAELLADRLALRQVGAPALARALWTAQCPEAPQYAAGFGEAGSLRVAQLLGDPIPRPWPPSALWRSSAIGIIFITGLGVCIAGGAISVL